MRERLLESKTKLDVIINHLKNQNHNWFLDNGIIVKDKGNYWVLNYVQYADKNPYNVLTRGLVVHKSGRIASCPFFRFFNYGEPTAAAIDFANADILEKLDGSLVGVFFPEGVDSPFWHFRSLLSAHQKDREFAIKGFVFNEESPLLMEVYPYLKSIEFKEDLKEYSLMFEFISRANAVVTKYDPDQYGLYLIGARHLPTLSELTELELDELARTLGIRRPKRWDASSYEEVIRMMEEFPKEKVYEGFVIRDRITGERNKIKNEDYLKRHRLLTKLNYKNLIPLYFDGERGEIEAYFPQSKEIFDKIETAYTNMVKEALKVLLFWQDKKVSRKEVALGIIGKESSYICSIVFKLLEHVKDGHESAIREFVRKMAVSTLIEAWNLQEIETMISEIAE